MRPALVESASVPPRATPAADVPLSPAALTLRDLTLGYGRHPAVHHVNGVLRQGDLLALVGPNGAGKSTLLKGIVGEAAILGGSLDLNGVTRRDIAYLPQRREIDLEFPIGVADFVAIGLWRRIGPVRRIGPTERRRVADALATVGLGGFEHRPIGTLSGGQMQRALVARTIVQDARLVLLDEPFAAVDERTTADLLAVVRGWYREGRTVVAALHDLDQVRSTFPLTLLLARDPIAWGPTHAVLNPANLARSRGLVEAWSDHAPACARAPDEGGGGGR